MNSAGPPDGDERVFDGFVDQDEDPGLNIDVLRRRRERVLTFLALVLVFGTIGYAAFKFARVSKPTEAELAVIAQTAVKEAFPGTAVQFDTPLPADFVLIAEGAYQISGQALVVNRDGASRTTLFVCTVQRHPDGQWRPAKLDLNPL